MKTQNGEVWLNKSTDTDWQMWGIPLCGRDMRGVLETIKSKVQSPKSKAKRKPFWIATVNPEFLMASEKDASFKEILKKTSLNVPDGIGLIWAREVETRYKKLETRNGFNKVIIGFEVGVEILQGRHRGEVVAGADLMARMCEMAAVKGQRVFFLGGYDDRAEKTARYFETRNSKPTTAGKLETGWSQGRPSVSNEEVLRQINKFKPDFLFVAYAMKKQEEWIVENIDKLKVGVAMGVGRSFDYYSGELKRAPKWVQTMGLEWLFSLLMEPKRWRRQLALPRFVWRVINGDKIG